MSTIDPVIAASLAAFAPPQSEVQQSAEELKTHNAVLRSVIKSGFPRCGHITPHHDELCRFDTTIEEVFVVCFLEYTTAERGSRENGVPIEPDLSEDASLCYVYVRDIDIASILSHDQIAEIEEGFLAQRVENFNEPDIDGMNPDETSFG